MARSVAKDGSAESPVTTFDSATDQRLVAVLTLANLDAGTKISYTQPRLPYRHGKGSGNLPANEQGPIQNQLNQAEANEQQAELQLNQEGPQGQD